MKLLVVQYFKSMTLEMVCFDCTACLVLCHSIPQVVICNRTKCAWKQYCSPLVTLYFYMLMQWRMKPWISVTGIHVVLDQWRAIRSLSLAAFQFTTKSYSGSSQKHSFPSGSKAILSGKIYPATWLGDRIQMGLFHMTCWCQPQIWIFLSLSFFLTSDFPYSPEISVSLNI